MILNFYDILWSEYDNIPNVDNNIKSEIVRKFVEESTASKAPRRYYNIFLVRMITKFNICRKIISSFTKKGSALIEKNNFF